MKTFSVTAAVLALSLVCFVGTAQAELVINGNLTSDVGWTWSGPHYPATGYDNGWPNYDHGVGDPTNANTELNNNAWLQQTIGTVSADTIYTVAYDAVQSSLGAPAYPSSYAIAGLYYDNAGVWTAIDPDGGAGSNSKSTGTTWATIAAGTWTVASPAYVGQSLAVRVTNGAVGDWASIDNISVISSPIPEPSALVLLGMGLISLLCYAWKKRK